MAEADVRFYNKLSILRLRIYKLKLSIYKLKLSFYILNLRIENCIIVDRKNIAMIDFECRNDWF